MSGATRDANWAYAGIEAVVLENREVRLVVLPSLGGKIYELRSKRDDVQFLWHNPRMLPKRAPFGANFDHFFVGGWDHPFPTLEPSSVGGEDFPYVGELWSLPWTWRPVEGDGWIGLEESVQATILPAKLTCRIQLADDAPEFEMHYRLENVGALPFDFMWGLHPCIALDPETRFHVPARKATVMQSPDEGVGRVGDVYAWPALEFKDRTWRVDTSLPPERGVFGLHELVLDEGWFEVERGSGAKLRVEFPSEIFRVLYLWMVYGGWRGIYHAALEPWTGGGVRLAEAIERGMARRLLPGESLKATVRATVAPGEGA
jgi:galactose mutarotase-like enzyme